jgi:hypothetical protein
MQVWWTITACVKRFDAASGLMLADACGLRLRRVRLDARRRLRLASNDLMLRPA